LEFIDFILKGDVALGFCAYQSNVTMGNSLDELGRERFHPLGIVLTDILYFSFKKSSKILPWSPCGNFQSLNY
jgi:hypothetical protein